MSKTVELLDFFKARGNTYTLLANLFLGKFEELKNSLNSAEIGVRDELSQMLNQLKETPIEELKVQYDNLFVVPASFFVPPFASYHLTFQSEEDEEAYFMKLNHFYQTFDFSLPFDKFERVDHIGYLLLFIAYINQATLDFIEENDKENVDSSIHFQKTFLNENIQSWIGTLEKEVSLKLRRGLLLSALRYLHQFVEWDIEELEKF